MLRVPRVTIGALGAVALVGALLTNALASGPRPSEPRGHAQAWKYNYHGNVLFNGVVRIAKNNSVYGKLYAHGGEQVWSGLLLNSGNLAITKGNLVVSSASSQSSFAGGVSVGGNLAAGNISGSALSLTGAASIAGAATIGGKLTASGGIDAGSSSITTTGGITAGTLTAANLNLSGTFQPANISTGTLTTSGGATIGGTLSAGNVNVGGTLTFNNAKVVGTVDFTNASVTGLGGGLSGTVPALTVGTTTGTTAPLTIQGNGGTATIGVSSAGVLQIAGLTTSGNVTVGGMLTTGTISGPPTGTASVPGVLNLQGTSVTLANGTDLNATLPSGTAVASHINANGDGDLAGQVTLTIPNTTTAGQDVASSIITFKKPFATSPVIILTPVGDPDPAGTSAPKVWVEIVGSGSSFTGFKIHYAPTEATVATTYHPTYDYIVLGS